MVENQFYDKRWLGGSNSDGILFEQTVSHTDIIVKKQEKKT